MVDTEVGLDASERSQISMPSLRAAASRNALGAHTTVLTGLECDKTAGALSPDSSSTTTSVWPEAAARYFPSADQDREDTGLGSSPGRT
eukprot:scaffold1076_cov37-Prasinocladus_malaysianus.AAC.2